MTETFRNHPTVMLKRLVAVAITLVLMVLLNEQTRHIEMLILYVVIAAISLFFIVRYWMKTTFTIDVNELVVERNTLFKNKKTIPYSKVASVNVVRDVFDRIFGTTTLSFNVNSGVNAAVPEASLVLKIEDAERIRSFVSAHMFDTEYVTEAEDKYESVVTFTALQVIIHGIFSMPTPSIIGTVLLSAYSILSLFIFPNSSSLGLITALSLLVINTIIPVMSMILRYYDFKVYRVDDTIRLQHGAIQKYRSSFDVHKINAVRVKRPLLARMMHKSCLEAEVVGINAVANDVRPVLCLLIDDDKLDDIMRQLVPEFMYEKNIVHQPEAAKKPIFFNSFVVTVIIFAIAAFPTWFLFNNAATLDNEITGIGVIVLKYIVPVVSISIIVAIWASSVVSLRVKGLDIGEDMFTFVNGIWDYDTITMQYDRVQITELTSGIVARRFGLAKCKIMLLSSAGHTAVKSGYFCREDLEKIGEKMLSRLSDGKYDCCKCAI